MTRPVRANRKADPNNRMSIGVGGLSPNTFRDGDCATSALIEMTASGASIDNPTRSIASNAAPKMATRPDLKPQSP